MTNHRGHKKEEEDTILEGLDTIHKTLSGEEMDSDTFQEATEVTGDLEEELETNWEPFVPPEEWEENHSIYMGYRNDPITDEARWPNMGSAGITLELIRWIASASTGDIGIARDISVAVPKIDITKAMYFDSKGTREQVVLLRDGVAIRSAAVCRYLTMGNSRTGRRGAKSPYIDIAEERTSISSHIERYVKTSALGKKLSSSEASILAQTADSLWYAAETERVLIILSPHILIYDQAVYASDVHARIKHSFIEKAGMLTDKGYVADSLPAGFASDCPMTAAFAGLVQNKLFRITSHMRDIIADAARPSFPLDPSDQIVKATTNGAKLLDDFLFSGGKSSTHVEKFMKYFEAVISECGLSTDDINEYSSAMEQAAKAFADMLAEQLTSQIESMMEGRARPSPSDIRSTADEAAEAAMGGVDDWEKSGEESSAATRVSCSADRDADKARTEASDMKDKDSGRRLSGAGSDGMGDRLNGLQSDFEWGGADLTIKEDHRITEVMLVPKISAPDVADSIAEYKDIVSEHKEYIRSTMRYISAILDDETGMFVKDHQTLGRIDPARLNQYWRTDEVFRTFEHIAGDRNYAIALVVDGSGSMSGKPIEQATAGAVIIAEALNDLEIPFSVMVFNTGYVSRLDEEHMDVYRVTSDPAEKFTAEPAPPGTFSGGAVINTLYKPLGDQRLTITDKCRLGYMIKKGAGGCNDDCYAIRLATGMLHKYRDRDHKIMIVISDGYPAGDSCGMEINGENLDQDDALKKIVEIAINSGINVIGLGICGHDNVSDYYPTSQRIDSLSDIPKVLGELLKETVRHGRRS